MNDPQFSRQQRGWKRVVPLLGSLALLTGIIWWISPQQLAAALTRLNWPVLAPLTLLLIISLYLWDSLCLWWLFTRQDRPLRYRTALRARGTSYLFTVINYGLGQGLLAWLLAKAQDRTFLSAALRCVIMTYVDVCVLLTLGLLGAGLSTDPRTDGVAWFCGVGLMLAAALAITLSLVPERLASRILASRLGQALHAPDWRWTQLLPLAALRMIYACHGIVYVTISLAASGLALEPVVVLTVIPVVVLIDGLPISISGLGTREATLLLLLEPEDPAVVVAFSLVWWACGIGGRTLIGAANVWLAGRPAVG